ncbi:RNA polymerase sigma factor [Carboxylicivirga sp. M1479]|uniref:RNA polymerase sigma factor n=1 Tax=Carboxylicivirga sp. M1479 TaxID=2594476 RepID=UPI001177DA8C|nr:RNA polymerase sigma factor [Carboxylicivirga sp. M1479]TRX66029.1 RNA polymerase sigma factor [Carboxylicivirga sp. M1479]
MISEKELIDKINNGETSAYRQLVEMHHKKVIHICLSFVNNSHDAEDIAQEVFIEMYRSLHGFRKEASLSTWLYRLSVNKSLDYIRQQKRLKRGSGKVTSIDQANIEQLQVSNSQLASDQIEENERMQLLYSAIDTLPKRQKEALILSQIKELSQQEVADTMNTSIGSIESLLVRAKRKLRDLLQTKKETVF